MTLPLTASELLRRDRQDHPADVRADAVHAGSLFRAPGIGAQRSGGGDAQGPVPDHVTLAHLGGDGPPWFREFVLDRAHGQRAPQELAHACDGGQLPLDRRNNGRLP